MLMNNNEYLDLVQTIKQEIQQAQYKATLSVNKELIILYYNIGKIINEHKSWGNKFIENLAADIKLSFPNAKGYSVRNLKYMSKFASTYPDEQFVQTVSAQIPWSHNVAILDKVKGEKQREWYIRKTAENGWSHNVLIHQIESGLYERQAIADKISNFESRLASPQSELAVQTMKDPYPTYTGECENGLVVVGYPKDRYWKHMSPSWDYDFIKNAPYTVLIVIGVNVFLIFLIYMIANSKLLKSVKPITNGIQALPSGEPVYVREKGLLSDLAAKINQTSDILQKQKRNLQRKETARAKGNAVQQAD